MRKSQNLELSLRMYFNLSLLLSFFPLPFLFSSSFVAHFIVLVLHGIQWLANFLGKGQINLQRASVQRNWQWIFPQNVTFFSECNSDRIGQNIQNEVSLERSIFEVVVVYQFIPCKQRPFDLPR